MTRTSSDPVDAQGNYRSSPSQVKTFEQQCPRKWAWEKIAGLRTPPNEFAAYGTRTHTVLENWFNKLEKPPQTPEGMTARAILRHLPPPQTPGIEIEKGIELSLGGVQFKGYIDLRMLGGRTPGIPFVSDHKTCGNFKWALSPNEMHQDIQATIYAEDTFLKTGAEFVELQWTYGTRGSRSKSLPVVKTVSRPQIQERIEKTTETVADMKEIYEAQVPPLEVPYLVSGCTMFKGCPFVNKCNLSFADRMKGKKMQENKRSLLASRLRDKKKKGEVKPAPAVQPEAQPDNAPEAEELQAKAEQEAKEAEEASKKEAAEKEAAKAAKKANGKKFTSRKKKVTAKEEEEPEEKPQEVASSAAVAAAPSPKPSKSRHRERYTSKAKDPVKTLLEETTEIVRVVSADVSGAFLGQYKEGFKEGFDAGIKAAKELLK